MTEEFQKKERRSWSDSIKLATEDINRYRSELLLFSSGLNNFGVKWYVRYKWHIIIYGTLFAVTLVSYLIGLNALFKTFGIMLLILVLINLYNISKDIYGAIRRWI